MRLFPELLLAAFVAGVGLGRWLDAPLPSAWPVAILLAAAVAVAVALRLLRMPAGPVILAAALLAGFWRAEAAPSPTLPIVPTGSAISVTVIITGAPAPAGSRLRFRGRVAAPVNGDYGSVPAGTNLLVYALPPPELVALRGRPHLRYGDTLRLSGQLARPELVGDFDYAAWLESQQIAAVMWARAVEVVSTGSGVKPAAMLHRIRGALASALQRAMPAPQSGLAQALLLGIRAELPHPVKESFRTAGMSHLLAISGLHVGIVMALTLAAAQAVAGRGSLIAIATAALVVWAYAVLSGADPPVGRAAIMGSLALAQGLTGRGVRGATALLLAAAVMLSIQPALLGKLSFQLSFMAMAGVILGLPVIAALTAAVTAPLAASGSWAARWSQYGLALLIASVVVSTTTTLATLPLVALHFGAIPLMSVPATILAMPALSAALLGAAATSLAGLAAGPLAAGLGLLAWAPLAWLTLVADVTPPLLLSAGWLTPLAAAGWCAGLGLLVWLASSRRLRQATTVWRRRPRWRPARAPALLAGAAPVVVITALLLAGQLATTRADGRLHVYLLDVGQGDAILVVTPEGRQMLVDGGPDAAATLSALGNLLPAGDRALDVVAATHLDSDHAGGLLGVLNRYRAGVVLQSVASPERALYPQWQGVLARRNHPVATVRDGHRVALGPDVMIEVLYPPQDGLPPGVAPSSNNASMVLRLTYGKVSFLLTGDIESDVERYLVAADAERLRSDVLKVAHHGSKTSTSPAFLESVNPRSAGISAGRDNQFGHPHHDVMARLESAVGGPRVFLTSRDGTIEYVSDGVGLWVNTAAATAR